MMRDELFDRDYQAAREALHCGVDAFVKNLANGFAALHRIQWSAPWKARGSKAPTC
jgi:hypothetical protein